MNDSEMLATKEWLVDVLPVAYRDLGRDVLSFELCDSVKIRLLACEGPKCWHVDVWIGINRIRADPTRGYVRQLCDVLGFPPLPREVVS